MRMPIAMAMVVFPAMAFPHDAPSGWTYPSECCADFDCREVEASTIKEGKGGYMVSKTGEEIPYNDARVRNSPDGEYHVCSAGGVVTGKTICIFVPPKGY